MQGNLNTCTLTSNKYNYIQMMRELQQHYGFDKIGEGGFGVVLGAKSCAIKLIKDIKRCEELEKEKAFYERIEENKPNDLLGRIPVYNLYSKLIDFCHFNTEKINSPLSEYDESEYKTRVGYVIEDTGLQYIFRDMKTKRGSYLVDKDKVSLKANRKIIHFYVNHYDVHFKAQSDERGNIMGLMPLIQAFSEAKVKEFCYALGQLVAFMVMDCNIYPFDVENVIGTGEDRVCTLYMYDFNECVFVDTDNLDLIALISAKALFNKDGKHYYPNNKHIYYNYFVEGLKFKRNQMQSNFIDVMLDKYNDMF